MRRLHLHSDHSQRNSQQADSQIKVDTLTMEQLKELMQDTVRTDKLAEIRSRVARGDYLTREAAEESARRIIDEAALADRLEDCE